MFRNLLALGMGLSALALLGCDTVLDEQDISDEERGDTVESGDGEAGDPLDGEPDLEGGAADESEDETIDDPAQGNADDPDGGGLDDPLEEDTHTPGDDPAAEPPAADEDGADDPNGGGPGRPNLSGFELFPSGQVVALDEEFEAPPNDWRQFQGDGQNQGFMPVRTADAGMKWRAEVGRTTYGSPVIGTDGKVYVGTLAGELVALNEDGSEQWRQELFPNSQILSTPAVDSLGNIYVISTRPDDEDDGAFVTALHKVSPRGGLIWTTGHIGFSTASPTLHGGYIFVPFLVFAERGGMHRRLFVFDSGGNEVTSTGMGGCSNTVCGSGPDIFGFFGDVWDFIKGIPPCGIPCEFDTSGLPILEQIWLDPTIAVVKYPGGGPEVAPLIIGVNNFCMTAFRFEDGELDRVWSRRLVGDDCDDPFEHSSPAVFANGMLVLGNKRNKVRAYDALTGQSLWTYNAGADVMSVAASFGRQVYVVAGNELHYLDYNGDLLDIIELGGESMASPVLSADSVYISATNALYRFSLDLSTSSVDHRFHGGFSPAAIGRDGTVYAATPYGELIAFGEVEEEDPPTVPPFFGSVQIAPVGGVFAP